MDRLDEIKLENAERDLNTAARQLEEMRCLGWTPSAAALQPHEDADKYFKALARLQAEKKELKPLADKAHEKRLGELLQKEAYLVESLGALGTSALNLLEQERREMFSHCVELMEPYLTEIGVSDEAAFEHFEVVGKAMQNRFVAMEHAKELSRYLGQIGSFGEFPMVLPFKSEDASHRQANNWQTFVSNYLAVLSQKLAGTNATATFSLDSLRKR